MLANDFTCSIVPKCCKGVLLGVNHKFNYGTLMRILNTVVMIIVLMRLFQKLKNSRESDLAFL
jgi:hypothetical protein